MKKCVYQLLENYMIDCMTDSAHDKEHVYSLLYNALSIADAEELVDYDILIAACLLHDIGATTRRQASKQRFSLMRINLM